MSMTKTPKTIIGWDEWVKLPDINLPCIKAKIDTGARTSALHAYDIETFDKNGRQYVRFKIHPIVRNRDLTCICEAPFAGHRFVTSSNGHKEKRFVITTKVCLGNIETETEITLTKRYGMSFRMLLGRNTLKAGKFIVDPSKACLHGKIKDPLQFYEMDKS
jgi:hypothetical protein